MPRMQERCLWLTLELKVLIEDKFCVDLFTSFMYCGPICKYIFPENGYYVYSQK